MTDAEPPLALPYYSARPAVPTSRLLREREDIERFARTQGLILGEFYIETSDEPGSKLQDMISAAKRRKATVVIVPTLADLGTTEAMQETTRQTLKNAGLRVLMLRTGGEA